MKQPVTPCAQNEALREKIIAYAEALKTQAHLIGDHGLSEYEFYKSGLFRGAIERLRGQFSAGMKEKRAFVAVVLDFMQSAGAIVGWRSAGEANRHDYTVQLNNGRTAAIELKGCLDGNNTNIFQRPPQAQEFLVWSVCQNQGADPRHNVWSGLHTRLTAEIIDRAQVVDGLIVWDMLCGTPARPCPKLESGEPFFPEGLFQQPPPGYTLDGTSERLLQVGGYRLPPPCLYVFPATIPSPRNNPAPPPQRMEDLGLMSAFYRTFGCQPEEVSYVHIEVAHQGADLVRRTRLIRADVEVLASQFTALQRA